MDSQTDNIDFQIVVHDDYDVDNEAFFNSFPPGYRFCPRDDELIVHYLEKKVNNQKLPPNRIRDVEISNYNPDNLAQIYPPTTEKEWYIFTSRDRKYPNGERPDRKAGDGYWKATGSDKDITLSNGRHVGFKKSLVFYTGKAPNVKKSNWIMHEFRVKGEEDSTRPISKGPKYKKLDDWVLCKIYKKSDKTAREGPNKKRQREDVDASIGNGEDVDTLIGNGDHEEPGPSSASSISNLSDMVLLNPSGVDESNRSLPYNLAPPLESYNMFTGNYPVKSNRNFGIEYPMSSGEPISFAPPNRNFGFEYPMSSDEPISFAPPNRNFGFEYPMSSGEPISFAPPNRNFGFEYPMSSGEPISFAPPNRNSGFEYSMSSSEPISFAPPTLFTESNCQPRSPAQGSTDDDWAFKQEKYEIFSQFDDNFFYKNCLDRSNSAHVDDLLQLPNATGTPPLPGN